MINSRLKVKDFQTPAHIQTAYSTHEYKNVQKNAEFDFRRPVFLQSAKHLLNVSIKSISMKNPLILITKLNCCLEIFSFVHTVDMTDADTTSTNFPQNLSTGQALLNKFNHTLHFIKIETGSYTPQNLTDVLNKALSLEFPGSSFGAAETACRGGIGNSIQPNPYPDGLVRFEYDENTHKITFKNSSASTTFVIPNVYDYSDPSGEPHAGLSAVSRLHAHGLGNDSFGSIWPTLGYTLAIYQPICIASKLLEARLNNEAGVDYKPTGVDNISVTISNNTASFTQTIAGLANRDRTYRITDTSTVQMPESTTWDDSSLTNIFDQYTSLEAELKVCMPYEIQGSDRLRTEQTRLFGDAFQANSILNSYVSILVVIHQVSGSEVHEMSNRVEDEFTKKQFRGTTIGKVILDAPPGGYLTKCVNFTDNIGTLRSNKRYKISFLLPNGEVLDMRGNSISFTLRYEYTDINPNLKR